MNTKNIILISLSFLCACDGIDLDGNDPKCLKDEILEFKKRNGCDGARVDEYEFLGSQVYLFEVGNCGPDASSPVLNDICEQIGFLGGFSGNAKIFGVEFSNAVFRRNIWKK